jgi:signal transduction histidine kinase
VELGIHGPVTEAQRTALGRVERAQRHLLGLIDTILNFARVEAGRIEYHLRETDLAELLADVAPMLEPQMRAGGLAFTVRRPTPSGLRAWADREKLEQVLLNLLSNAARFTAAGGRVTVRAEPVPDRPDLVRLVVADTGIGIPADKVEAIFEPFVQIRSGTPRPPAGTGLGLAISRDLARGMGGDVVVESRPGKGSRFSVLLRRV